ncbi:LAFE_0F05446g1_1 [Lachancea fermentati]|uniref:LAFE_0F05446g1_1 n=1 Tax=Lachancea fermentati TaxID=4955 RepID=A0A1G4MEW0_LACFM|nr:LAFE_0F05446g1_1 [Lachancea fermentati]
MSMDGSQKAEYISIAELVETDVRFVKLKQQLSHYEKDSREYLEALYDLMPLSSYLNYKKFLKQQSVPAAGSKSQSGYSATYRSALSPNKLISCVHPKLATAFDLFNFSVECHPDNDCLGERIKDPITGQLSEYYVFETYREIQERSRNFGSGIMTIVNLKRQKSFDENGFIVSIMSANRKEWIIADLACQAYSLANTALYETLGPETSEFIMNLTESPVLILSQNNIYRALELLPKLPNLNTLICMDNLDSDELFQLNNSLLPKKRNEKGEAISLLTLKQVEDIGARNKVPLIPPKPETLYTISFTSGTTGVPKGVEMKHSHISAGVAMAASTFRIPAAKRGKQLHDMCFLPLAHIFERMISGYALSRGIGLGFLHKADPAVLVEDLKLLKPDILSLVPRVLTKFEAGIKNSLTNDSVSSMAKSVAKNILNKKQARFTARGGQDHSLINNMVFHRVLIDRIRASLGLENTDFLITGSAPISNDTLLFMKSALDCGIRQGYGLTESYAGICISEPHERDSGSCGGIGISTECRLKSVPEMGYDAEKHLKGELQLRGPQIFDLYFKNKKETNKVLDSDGWFSTGDIGHIDEKGRLRIVDRVKNFFKLAQGEYIAPEKIENLYLSSCPYLTQLFIHGDSLRTYLVAVVGLDMESVTPILHRRIPSLGHLYGQDLINALNDRVPEKTQLLKLINGFIKGLQGFEKIHNIVVGIEPLKVEDDTITPTFKVKRAKAIKHFRSEFDHLYEQGSLIRNEKL